MDTVREPLLILDAGLCVQLVHMAIAACPPQPAQVIQKKRRAAGIRLGHKFKIVHLDVIQICNIAQQPQAFAACAQAHRSWRGTLNRVC